MKLSAVFPVCFFFLVIPLSAAVAPEAMTAGDLEQICIASDVQSKTVCRFYILGFVQGMTVGMSIADGKTKGGRPCIPERTSGTALELAVKTKMGEDLMAFPEDRKLDAAGLVSAILIHQFPCQKRK